MAESAQVMFFTRKIPPEEQLPRLIEEYNALADKWTDQHAELAAARDREKGLREALELIVRRSAHGDLGVALAKIAHDALHAPETHDEGKP